MLRRLSWGAMTFLAVAVAAYAAAALATSALRSPFIQNLFVTTPAAVSIHLIGGIIAIVIGAIQVNSRLRNRYLQAHRWLGRVYVLGVFASGTAGLILSFNSSGGLVAHFGFGMMAICWLGCTATAYYRVRVGDISGHRAWMLRSYALTLAAVTLRIYLPISLANGVEFEAAYQAIAWLCWVPNILIVEWIVLGSRTTQTVATG